MADVLPRDRLLPCLLDRLADDKPVSGVESGRQRAMSARQYVAAVYRDLEWLLNSRPGLTDDLDDEFDQLGTSVLNFGIPDICGLTASGIQTAELEQTIRQAILNFEPRILRRSLIVRAIETGDADAHNTIGFEITGEVWALPVAESFCLKTELDLETGQVSLKE